MIWFRTMTLLSRCYMISFGTGELKRNLKGTAVKENSCSKSLPLMGYDPMRQRIMDVNLQPTENTIHCGVTEGTVLPYIPYVFGRVDMSKQCRLKSDSAECSVWSGSTPFATPPLSLGTCSQFRTRAYFFKASLD